MKKIKTAAFFLILAILIAFSSFIFDPSAPIRDEGDSSTNIFTKISLEPENTIDVLVLGDSESYTSVSPMELWKENGTTSYVCGIGGMRIQRAYYLLKQALKTQQPKVLLMETNMLFRSKGKVDEAETLTLETMNYYLPLFRYHNDWKKLVDHCPDLPRDYKGFTIKNAVDPYSGEDYMKKTKEKQNMTIVLHIFATEIVKLCKENDIQVILYSAPSPVNHSYQKHNALQAFADENNCEYLDLNLSTKEIGINWSKDTLDKGDHLNINGTVKTSSYISRYLKENYTLIDHRNDENYQDWASLLKKYEEDKSKL